jgi:Fe-S-cluster containining protein
MNIQRAIPRSVFMTQFYSVTLESATILRMSPGSNSKLESNFSTACFRCGECCTRYQVLLEEFEVTQVADYLSISPEKLKADYTDPRWPVPGKFLLRHRDNGGCIFLVHHGKEALCSIHSVKPNPCKAWTAGLSRKECGQGLSRDWGLVANEAGELCGAEHDKQAFLEYLSSISL